MGCYQLKKDWANLRQKLLYLKIQNTCTVRQFTSLIGLLTATEKHVWSGDPHETHTVAPETTLACSRNSGKNHSLTHISSPKSRLVVGRKKCGTGSTDASLKSCPLVVYRRIKQRLGRTLMGLYCKRRVVRCLHINFLELKAVFLALKSLYMYIFDFLLVIRLTELFGGKFI